MKFYVQCSLNVLPYLSIYTFHHFWYSCLPKEIRKLFELLTTCQLGLSIFLFYFVLQHINLISHLMPNRVKEYKSEKKSKGDVLGIKDKL